jgi:hypothetical protein
VAGLQQCLVAVGQAFLPDAESVGRARALRPATNPDALNRRTQHTDGAKLTFAGLGDFAEKFSVEIFREAVFELAGKTLRP